MAAAADAAALIRLRLGLSTTAKVAASLAAAVVAAAPLAAFEINLSSRCGCFLCAAPLCP